MLRRNLGITIVGTILVTVLMVCFALNHYKKDLYDLSIDMGAKAAGLTKQQIQINDHQLYYLENPHKNRQPTLLLVHGFGAFKENWIKLAIELKDNFHIISIDLPGHGESSFYTDNNYDIDFQAQALKEFADRIIKRPFIMAGNSMGGAITALYAATYPDDLQAVLLIDPGNITDVKSELYEYLANGIHPLIVESQQDFDFMMAFVMEQPPFLPWPLNRVSKQKMVDRLHKNKKIWQDISGKHNYDFKAMITNIRAPTLIAWGKQDRVLNYQNAYVFNQLIPNSTVHLFDKVGHAPMIEIPQQLATVINQFVAHSTAAN